MTEHDDDLKKLLSAWTSPAPSVSLNHRVRRSYEDSQPRVWKRWMPVAAAFVLAVGLAAIWRPAAPQSRPADIPGTLRTRVVAAGFRPLPDGAIRITEGKARPGEEKQ